MQIRIYGSSFGCVIFGCVPDPQCLAVFVCFYAAVAAVDSHQIDVHTWHVVC